MFLGSAELTPESEMRDGRESGMRFTGDSGVVLNAEFLDRSGGCVPRRRGYQDGRAGDDGGGQDPAGAADRPALSPDDERVVRPQDFPVAVPPRCSLVASGASASSDHGVHRPGRAGTPSM
jgi:hypothetical protein